MPLSPTELLTVIAIAKKEAAKVIPEFRQPSDGLPGKDGDTIVGPQGPKGDPGESIVGPKGDNGDKGDPGVNGANGLNGDMGPKGDKGQKGDPGRNGTNGKDGAGIDEVAIGDDGHLYVGFDDGRVIDAGRVRGKDGKPGKPGINGGGAVGGGGGTVTITSPPDWNYYVTKWDTAPTSLGLIAGGEVFSYTLSGVTRFRFVPSLYDAALDAFYSTFASGVLSGLAVTRGG